MNKVGLWMTSKQKQIRRDNVTQRANKDTEDRNEGKNM